MPPIDIKSTVQQVLAQTEAALMSIVTNEIPEVTEAVNAYINNAKQRFTDLLSYMADGGDVKFLLDRLSDEKGILESEVLSFEVIGKQVAQTVINSIQDILIQAIRVVLPEA